MAQEALDALIIDAVPTLVIVFDHEARIIRFNHACEQVSGYSAAEMSGKRIWETLVAPEDRDRAKHVLSRTFAGEKLPELQTQWVTRSGERRHILWSRAAHCGADGKVKYLIGTGTDVTEKLKTERELRDKETWLGKLIETAHEGIGIIDPEGRLTYANPRLAEMLGYTVPEMLGRAFFELMSDDEREASRRRLENRRRGIAETYEVRMKRKDGSEFWVQNKTNPLLDENGKMIASLGMVADITERKRAEDALRAMNEKLEQLVATRTATIEQQARILRSVLQSMGESVIVSDKDGNVILTNPAADRIAGGAPAAGQTVDDRANANHFFRADASTEYRPHEVPLARAIRGENVDNEEVFMRRAGEPDGMWVSITARPLRDESGELAGGVLVGRDITGRHRVEQMVIESERHFRELAERNRLLLQEVDHRVRNNLSALIGLITLMRQRTQSVPAFADAIESRIQGMAHVHQMLAETGWQPVELQSLVESTLKAMQHLAPHQIVETVAGPSVMITPRRALPMAMIVVEWFTNSCKYGAHSRPEGRVDISWTRAPSGEVCLRWKEQGGPPVSPPLAPSLGTELVRAFATRELAGTSESHFEPGGVEHVLRFHTDGVRIGAAHQAAATRSA